MVRSLLKRTYASLCTVAFALACSAVNAQDASRATQNFIDAANLACLAADFARNSGVRCWLAFPDGKPALVLSVRDRSRAQQIAPLVLSMVGTQLCTAVNADTNGAAFVIADAANNPVSFYSCEQRTFVAWSGRAGR